jgi:hypothetical protein
MLIGGLSIRSQIDFVPGLGWVVRPRYLDPKEWYDVQAARVTYQGHMRLLDIPDKRSTSEITMDTLKKIPKL